MKTNVHLTVNAIWLRLFKYCNYEVTGAGTNNTDVIHSICRTVLSLLTGLVISWYCVLMCRKRLTM